MLTPNYRIPFSVVANLTKSLTLVMLVLKRCCIGTFLFYVNCRVMGPLLILVCPCLRENVIVTGKIVSFLCSLVNVILKNVIGFFFGNQISNWRSLKKRYYWPTFTFFSHQGNDTKICTYFTYIHTRILLTLLTFLPYQFCKNYEFIMHGFSLVRHLVLILIRAILEQSINNKMVSEI